MQAGTEINPLNSLLSKWLNRVKKSDEPKGVQPRPEGVKVPLSMGQQRLLFLQQLYPENPFYHYADIYRFKGKLDVGSLIKSFEIAAERHNILRSKVVFENGKAFQEINDKPLFEISEHDLRSLPITEVEKIYQSLAVQEARKPLDSPNGYLTRLSFLRLKEDEFLVVLTMHHIVTDKWSMYVLRSEVAEYYQKLTKGEEVNFSPLEIQYADYAYWQSLQKTNSANLEYWTNKLENSLAFLDIPTDFPRPNRPTFRGAYSTQNFSGELSSKLKDFCKKTNKTLYVVMLTAYKILLKCYSGETDILVGSPFTNRDEIALENLIGFFNDTLVLRSDLSNDPTFIELLEQVWTTTQDSLTHKNMPFETLVKSLKIERYANYNPLFQVMFIYHDVPQTPHFGNDLEIEHEPFDFGVTKFDLTLFVAEEEDKITAIFEYAKDLFVEKTIHRMHGHLRKLLEEIVADPTRRISELPIVTDEELELFSEWNNTHSLEKKATSIVELFQKQVELKETKTAVSFQNEKLTYEELNKRANSVANYLVQLDLDKRQPIGILVESSLDMIVGILGVLKAGLAYLPLDAEYPKERINFILKDSAAKVVLTQIHLADSVSDDLVKVETIEGIINSETLDELILPNPIEEEDLAYVIYTSGSTGKPKGVCVTHKNLVYSATARFDYYPNQPKSFLLLSSFSFDSSIAGIFWTLSTGGKLVLTKRRAEQDLNHLAEVFVNENISHTLLLPTLYSTVIKHIPKENFGSFETIIVAGEACPKSLCKEHFEILPNVELYNEYGPTEATVWATAHKITPKDLEFNIPIGKPISDTQIYILDENQNQVPVGVTGEMYIGGKGVANGYLNNSELTNKFFLPNTFSPLPSDKLYRTGDLCRYRSDGKIEFLGRKDNQVKIRGYRIELGEIQEAIMQDSTVHEVVIKLETTQKSPVESDVITNETLLDSLQKMDILEADKILKSVEKLSAKEIEFMLNEMENS